MFLIARPTVLSQATILQTPYVNYIRSDADNWAYLEDHDM